MYTCIIYLRGNLMEINMYDDKGKLSRYERIDLKNKLIEISSKYVRLMRSELSNSTIAVCQVNNGLIKVNKDIVFIA